MTRALGLLLLVVSVSACRADRSATLPSDGVAADTTKSSYFRHDTTLVDSPLPPRGNSR